MAKQTSEYQQFFEYWVRRLDRDLTPFIDPGTELKATPRARSVMVEWYQRARYKKAEFVVSAEDGVTVNLGDVALPYKAFMASPEMADLLAVAKMTLQAQRPSLFVETKARRIDGSTSAGNALAVLQDALIEDPNTDATNVVMVTGEAGTGKTSVLKHLVRAQSDMYVRGKTQCLYLYVNAQGRALARFNEALATELDELRASLTYHQVAPLVRTGLLIPVVDGFDELLGVGGYDDAFSSLSTFIEELDGSGHLVASARSTYYEQEFVARANKSSSLGSQVWRQIPVEILEWQRSEFDEYIEKKGGERGYTPIQLRKLRADMGDLFSGANEPLRSKPFFVSRAVEMRIAGKSISRDGDLLEQLVENYIERERLEKLLDRHEAPMLTNQQIRMLLIELAEEMWNQETRELDQRSVREITEYVLESLDLNENVRRIVKERITAFAFLMAGELGTNIAFEHEVFFAYFLAQRICRSATSGSALTLLLGRSILPLDAARIAGRTLASNSNHDSLQSILTNFRTASVSATMRASQTQENVGVLALSVLIAAGATGGPIENLELGDFVVPGLNLDGLRIRDSRFKNIQFRRTNFADAAFEKCIFEGVSLVDVTVDPGRTKLWVSGLDVDRQVVGLNVIGEGEIGTTFDPTEIRAFLRKVGVLGIRDVEDSVIRKIPPHIGDLLDKFTRLYLRANPVCVNDDTNRRIFEDSLWPELQESLLQTGVVTLENRFGKGRKPKVFLRRQVLAQEILAGRNRNADAPDSVRRFWDLVEKKYQS